MLNLNFSKLVCIGEQAFEIEKMKYKHKFFITEDALENYKYYLIGISRNITDRDTIDKENNDILLESLFISEVSIKKDIPNQIALILNKLGFVKDTEYAAASIGDIDMSFFEFRYNFYKNGRVDKFEDLDAGDILCTFFKVKKVCENGSHGAIVQDIGLYNIKKMIYSAL